MGTYDFIPPLCLSCGVSLEQKQEIDKNSGVTYVVNYCPNCEEIYRRMSSN